MTNFEEALEKLYQELNIFLDKYNVIDEEAPLSGKLIKYLKKTINHMHVEGTKIIKQAKTNFISFNQGIEIDKKTAQASIDTLEEGKEKTLISISNKYAKKLINLEKEIKNSKIALENKIHDLQIDIDSFVGSSNQTYESYVVECESSLKKYEYQIDNAIDTYNQSIEDFYEMYEAKQESITERYNESIKRNSHEAQIIIDKLEARIKELETDLKHFELELQSIKFQIKERNRQESMTLNEEIKKLMDERNQKIVEARQQYQENLKGSNDDKEEKHKEYQQESQQILKEFVYSISEQDEYLTNARMHYEEKMEAEKRDYYYKSLDLSRRQNDDFSSVITNDEKITKKNLKLQKKNYYILKEQLMDDETDILNKIEQGHNEEVEKSRHAKAILELNKNYNLKVINEKEQQNNKYHQQLDNIYENNMNLSINIANLKYNQQANLAKCKSRIRSKDIEKDSDFSEAKIQQNIERITTDILKLQLDINCNKSLCELTNKFELDNYENRKKNLSVSKLLEIEKYKILNNYNKRQYEYNCLISNTHLKYAKDKLDLENNKNTDLGHILINKNKVLYDLKKELLNIQIKTNDILKKQDIEILNRNTQYEKDNINASVSKNRLKRELVLIEQITSNLIILIKNMEIFCFTFTQGFFDDIQVRPEYVNLINNFLNGFNSIIFSYYKNLYDSVVTYLDIIVEKRKAFENEFKYDALFNKLEETHNNEINDLNNRIKNINDALRTYDDSLASTANRVYNLKNQKELVKGKIKITKKPERDKLIAEDRNYQNKMDELIDKYNEVFDLKNKATQEINLLQETIKNNNEKYEENKKAIEKMRLDSLQPFMSLSNSVKKYINQTLQKKPSNYNKIDSSITTNSKTIRLLTEEKNNAARKNTITFKALYNYINKFTAQSNQALQKDREIILNDYTSDINKIWEHNNSLLNVQNELASQTNNKYNSELNNLQKNYNQTEQNYQKLLNENDKKHQNENEDILEKKKESMTTFYTEYYSMCRNLENVASNFKNETKQAIENYKNNKKRVNAETLEHRKEASIKLQDFKNSKQDLINHLPIATKFFKSQLTKETELFNLNLDEQIKQARINTSANNKAIDREINVIELTGNQSLDEQKNIYQRNVDRENQKSIKNLRKINRTKINFNLNK